MAVPLRRSKTWTMSIFRFVICLVGAGIFYALADEGMLEDDREAIRKFADITDFAFFTVVQSDAFVDGALVMACSFFANENRGPLIALVANVSDAGLQRLRNAGMHFVRVKPLGTRDLAIRHETFTKLLVWTFDEFKEVLLNMLRSLSEKKFCGI